ncbi:hypothetical protein ACQ4M3_09405 [Leptolyngbya sp. AN03gr2]|uniref:hypothetical protein n=1 Tax=Leptolyngbya sp. AN03gr2 TaxID=3423364 RepID=UPI003D313B25
MTPDLLEQIEELEAGAVASERVDADLLNLLKHVNFKLEEINYDFNVYSIMLDNLKAKLKEEYKLGENDMIDATTGIITRAVDTERTVDE